MKNEIQKTESKEVQIISKEKLIKYLDLFQQTSNLTETEKSQFIEIAAMSNLNPFKREIYITAYGEGRYRSCSIITGYEVYIKRAEMSGLLDGWSTKIEKCAAIQVNNNGSLSDTKDIKAIITIHRKDFSHPYIHEVKFSEYVQKKKDGTITKFWKEKPETMLKKVAISQGFRMCFNEILGGMPYTKEELLNEQQTIDISYQDIKNNEDIKDAGIELMIDEAIKSLPDCDSEPSLSALYSSYPDIKKEQRWLDALKEAKKLIDDKNK